MNTGRLKKHKMNIWLQDLKKRIMKGFGPKCPDFYWNCSCCMAWLAYEILEDLYEMKEKKHEKI